jgi:hypothetical protein
MRETAPSDFAGGEAERDKAVGQTEHDYMALVEVGAEAARLEGKLELAEREQRHRADRHLVATTVDGSWPRSCATFTAAIPAHCSRTWCGCAPAGRGAATVAMSG